MNVEKDTMAWQRIIILLEDAKNGSRVAYDLNLTYSHVIKCIVAMKNKGWIKIEKKGRENKFIFTKKGREMKKACETMIGGLGGLKRK